MIVGTKQTGMLSDYNVHESTNFVDYYYPCCGFFKVNTWGNEHPSCSKIVRPYRQHQFQLLTEVCMHCGKHFINAIQYFQHQDSMYYGIRAIICSLCHGVYLSEAMMGFHITESHGGPHNHLKMHLLPDYVNV